MFYVIVSHSPWQPWPGFHSKITSPVENVLLLQALGLHDLLEVLSLRESGVKWRFVIYVKYTHTHNFSAGLQDEVGTLAVLYILWVLADV